MQTPPRGGPRYRRDLAGPGESQPLWRSVSLVGLGRDGWRAAVCRAAALVATCRHRPKQPGRRGPPEPPAGPWDFLAGLTPDEILLLVAAEHPQTIAIVLGQLPPAKAAAVLAGLSEEAQAAVGRRVAVLHQVDPVVITEVGRSLTERAAELAKTGPAMAGAEGRVAEILRHAGYATEKAVLNALAGQAPSLAEAVRRRLFRFEDLAQLPADRLRLFGSFLVVILLFFPTLGLIWFWYQAKKQRYFWEHTSLATAHFHSTVTGTRLFLLTVGNLVLLVATLGLGFPWIMVRNVRFAFRYLTLEGPLDLSGIQQEAQAATATGEALAGFLDAGLDLG